MKNRKDIMWQRITSFNDPLFEAVWPLYVESFPEYERRPRSAYAVSLADPRFHADVLVDLATQEVYALLWYWRVCDLRYLEYFAIAPTQQGSGLGTDILKAFIEADADPIILEIEELVDATSTRRWHFYERLGFSLHEEIDVPPPYVLGHQPYRVHLLTSAGNVSGNLFGDWRARFIHARKTEIILPA